MEVRASAARGQTRCGTALPPAPQPPDAAQFPQRWMPKPAAYTPAKSWSREAQPNMGISRGWCAATRRSAQLHAACRSGACRCDGSKPATAPRPHPLPAAAEQTVIRKVSPAKWPGVGAQVIIADEPFTDRSCTRFDERNYSPHLTRPATPCRSTPAAPAHNSSSSSPPAPPCGIPRTRSACPA